MKIGRPKAEQSEAQLEEARRVIWKFRAENAFKDLPTHRYMARSLGLKSQSDIGRIYDVLNARGWLAYPPNGMFITLPSDAKLTTYDLVTLVAKLHANGTTRDEIYRMVEVGLQRVA